VPIPVWCFGDVNALDSSVELAQRLNATAGVCTVVASTQLSSSIHEVTLAGQASVLAGVPGNDVMVQFTNDTGRMVRRRYSVRAVDAALDEFTLWITTAHDGVGSSWAKGAVPGDEMDVIGPRAKSCSTKWPTGISSSATSPSSAPRTASPRASRPRDARSSSSRPITPTTH